MGKLVHQKPDGGRAIAPVRTDQINLEFRDFPIRQHMHEVSGRKVAGALDFGQMRDAEPRPHRREQMVRGGEDQPPAHGDRPRLAARSQFERRRVARLDKEVVAFQVVRMVGRPRALA